MATEYVTHRDLDAFKTEMRGEFALLRGEFAELRGEFRELRGKFREFGGETRGEFNATRGDMKSFARTRTIVLANIGSMLGFGGLVLAAAQFA